MNAKLREASLLSAAANWASCSGAQKGAVHDALDPSPLRLLPRRRLPGDEAAFEAAADLLRAAHRFGPKPKKRAAK